MDLNRKLQSDMDNLFKEESKMMEKGGKRIND